MLATILFILVVIFVIILQLKGKGWAGEHSVAKKLRQLPHGYIVFNDLLLKNRVGGTTQIDHVVISEYGIFVIETKNYKGIILGSEYGESWTKNMFGHKYRMTNPVTQNQSHIRTIARLLTQYNIGCKIYSIITFPKTAKVRVRAESCEIVQFKQLRRTILRHKDVQMNWETTQRVATILKEANITDKNARRAHKHYVKSIVELRQNKVAHDICPNCGAPLIKRKGKYGIFYGCSNYPKCKFIAN